MNGLDGWMNRRNSQDRLYYAMLTDKPTKLSALILIIKVLFLPHAKSDISLECSSQAVEEEKQGSWEVL